MIRSLAAGTGESKAVAVSRVGAEQLQCEQQSHDPTLIEDLHAIAGRCATLPVLDDRDESEILGYDENGLPGQ